MLFNFTLKEMLLILPTLLISLTFHEYIHGVAANKLGDTTGKYLGRLTLNPLAHLDPFGALSMLITGFGWAKPVPVNPLNFKKPRRDMAITALCGPLANLVLAFLGVIAFYMVYAIAPVNSSSVILSTTIDFIQLFALINLNLAIFNIIPFPPLDGSKVLYAVLPDNLYFRYMRYEQYGMIVLFALLFTGVITRPLSYISQGILSGMEFVVRGAFSLFGINF